MNDREQIISFLLQSGDSKDRIIADLQKQVAELKKQFENKGIVLDADSSTKSAG